MPFPNVLRKKASNDCNFDRLASDSKNSTEKRKSHCEASSKKIHGLKGSKKTTITHKADRQNKLEASLKKRRWRKNYKEKYQEVT